MKKGKDSTGCCLEIASVTVANDDVADEFKEIRQTALTDDSTSESPITASETELAASGLKAEYDSEILDIPAADFHDFDLSRAEECFRVGDLWATYDNKDDMPRFYAFIDKVESPDFKVETTWLDPVPEDQDVRVWIRKGLPIACGKFKENEKSATSDVGKFSHKVSWEMGSITQDIFNIYPRKGEIWALFKWNNNWNSDVGNHRTYEYEYAEVLSDYNKESGASVGYLDKIEGFVSLFKPRKNCGVGSFQVLPNELLRFSHMVPSFRTTGNERKDVPEGYFELDPASLPSTLDVISSSDDVKVSVETINATTNGNLDEVSHLVDVNVNTESVNGIANGNFDEVFDPVDVNVNAGTINATTASCRSQEREDSYSPKKRKYLEDKVTADGRNSKGGGCFAKSLCEDNKKKRSEESAPFSLDKNSCGSDGTNEALKFGADFKEMGADGLEVNMSQPLVDVCRVPAAEFYNFENDRSHDKFQLGQIWALNSELDGLPKHYAQINSVELSPDFKMGINMLEACNLPKGVIQWLDKKIPICCGTFTAGKTYVFSDTASFSHLSIGVSTNKENMYDIYPKKGEVWALYRNCKSDWTCSDLNNCKYDMVEVQMVYDCWIIVMVLEQVAGFKTVFRAKTEAGFNCTMGVPWIELFRFSHQVPAFQLTEAKYGGLRGCLELDPKSMPACLLSTN
ncbi:uncharacterized protein LOC113297970 [Papaver somniferum]|uniref:uncharacterized protein LOC113297970 n=1 Tax=Papaver somniferum TaxID=3469 RepID=UPI000E6F5581|nr:uncharacterized protein LOC113297970 [Papaver somniferum]